MGDDAGGHCFVYLAVEADDAFLVIDQYLFEPTSEDAWDVVRGRGRTWRSLENMSAMEEGG